MLMRPPGRASAPDPRAPGPPLPPCPPAPRARLSPRKHHGLQAALALKHRRAVHAQLDHRKSAHAHEVRTPVGLPGNTATHGAQASQLLERHGEVDVGCTIGQAVDLERLRPGRRHGARIIGIGSPQVKADLPCNPLFREDDSGQPMTAMPRVLLASTSRYRRELLSRLGWGSRPSPRGWPRRPVRGNCPWTGRCGWPLRRPRQSPPPIRTRWSSAATRSPPAGGVVLDKPGDCRARLQQLWLLSAPRRAFHTACAVRWHNTGSVPRAHRRPSACGARLSPRRSRTTSRARSP